VKNGMVAARKLDGGVATSSPGFSAPTFMSAAGASAAVPSIRLAASRASAFALIVVALLLPLPGALAADAAAADAGRWVASHGPGDGDAAAALRAEVVQAGGRVLLADEVLGFVAFSAPSPPSLDALPDAFSLQPDVRVSRAFIPDDPQYPAQWAPPAIGLPEAWNRTRGSHDVTIAVIDDGLAYTHPDIAANVCTLGPDYADGDMDPRNDEFLNEVWGEGHGTAVTGALGAVIGNTVGISGTGNLCLMPIRHDGFSTSVAAGLRWAADHGADVASMSFSTSSSPPMAAAISYAADAGMVLVAAAGNSGCSDGISYPATDPLVIAVGALSSPDARASFSQCGADLELMAPGEAVRTLSGPTGYATTSGTSIATPIVAGAAGLVLSAAPGLDAVEVRQLLAGAAADLGEPGRAPQRGLGRLDAALAIRVALGEATPGPVDLQAERGPLPGQIRLTWDVPDLGGVTSFNLYRGTSADDLAPLASTSGLAFTDAGLPEGTRYVYGVSAVGAAGESRVVHVAQAVPQRPSAPQRLRAAPSDPGAIVLSWQPPATDGGFPVQAYRVYRGNLSGQERFLVELAAPATSFGDAGCPMAVTCHYLLSAVNAVAEGVTSNEASPVGTVGPASFYAFGESEGDQVAVGLTRDARAPVAVTGWGDAEGRDVASLTGTAHGDRSALSAFGDAEGGEAVSGTGDADGDDAVAGSGRANGTLAAVSVLGEARGGVAASAADDADGSLAAISVLGDARSQTLPFSVLGDCNGQRCVAATRGRDADGGTAAASWRGNSTAPVAVSAFGRADGTLLAVSVFGDATGGVAAASAFGDAFGTAAAASVAGDGTATSAAASVLGDAACDVDFLFCVSASVAGDAAGCQGYPDCTAASLFGNSTASQAASGTGEADGWHEEHSGCDMLRQPGLDAACLNPYRLVIGALCNAAEARPIPSRIVTTFCA
jgi:hypothetical protein